MEKKNPAFDLIRSLAIVFVVFIHSSGAISKAVLNGEASMMDHIVKACLCVIGTGVPLFVMISGALLLGREECMRTFFTKRLHRVLLPFVVWSIIVYPLFEWQNGNDILPLNLLQGFFMKFFTGGVYGIYWYIYMLLGLYLLVPVLRIYYRYCSERMALYLPLFCLVVHLVGILFPQVKIFSRFMSENMLFLFYFTTGYVVNRYLIQKKNFAKISLYSFIVVYMFGIVGELVGLTLFSTFTIVISISLFCLLCTIRKPILGKWGGYFSKISYGIYLSHFIFISIFCKLGLEHSVPLWIEPFVMVLLVMFFECVMLYFVDKIKLGKYLM